MQQYDISPLYFKTLVLSHYVLPLQFFVMVLEHILIKTCSLHFQETLCESVCYLMGVTTCSPNVPHVGVIGHRCHPYWHFVCSDTSRDEFQQTLFRLIVVLLKYISAVKGQRIIPLKRVWVVEEKQVHL